MEALQQKNKQFINGEWRDGQSGRSMSIYNPFDNSIIESVILANEEDIDEAYKAAKAAQKDWAKATKEEKIEVLQRVSERLRERRAEIVDLLIRETGSTVFKANLEIHLVEGLLQEALNLPGHMEVIVQPSALPGKENYIYRLPAGVVATISPFNVPLYLSMRAIVPAIATGNAVVHKPDFQTSISAGYVIASLFEEAGLPKGVFNLIVTDISEIGDAFLEHPIPRIISFTGSTAVGRRIGEIAGRNLKRAALELGGNSPFIVLEDADIDQAVKAAVFGKFVHQGQICMIINRILVQRSVYDEFVEKFVAHTASLTCGNPSKSETVIGPVINERQADKIMRLVESAKQEGATVALEGNRTGNVISPFIFTDVRNEMEIAKNEIFGPVAVIIPFETEEEGFALANDTEYGLSSAIFTSDLARGLELAQEIESGITHINDQTVNDEPTVPFGGEKASGLGRYNGIYGLEEFTTYKWVSMQKTDRQYPF